jgi:hypothetical protein
MTITDPAGWDRATDPARYGGPEPIYTGLLAAGPGPLLTFDPPDPLTASLARETELLAALDTATHDGWVRALTEAHAHLTAAGWADAAAALTALTTPTRRTPTSHHLAVRVVPGLDVPEYRVTCAARPGAVCHQACEGSVRGDCVTACRCDGTLVDTGTCLVASWLDADPGDLFAGYAGPARPLTPGPIAVCWTRNGWEWLYPEDAPCPDPT